MIRRLIASACAALLTACGGGGAVEAGQPTMRAMSRPASAPDILFMGDSTFTPVYPGELSTPDYAAGTKRYVNVAVSGTMACQAPLDAVRQFLPRVVVSNFAINDSDGATLDQYRQCLRQIAQVTAEVGAVLVLVEANPIVPGGRWSYARSNEAIATFEAEKQAVARDTGSYYCRQPQITWTLTQIPDGVHPGDEAKPLIGAAINTCIERADQ